MEINDFDGEEFYGFCSDFEQRKGKFAKNREKKLKAANIYIIPTYMGGYGRMERRKLNLGEKKEALSKKIELSLCFEELGGNNEQFRTRVNFGRKIKN